MRNKLHAIGAILKKNVFETLIHPGFYITQTAGMLMGYYLIRGFTGAIDSGGFNYMLHPVYDMITRTLVGAFGQTYVIKLFSDGPYLFAFHVSFIPVFIYIAISSVSKLSLEKNSGAMGLILYGPADDISYLMGNFLRDFIFTAIYILLLFFYFLITAKINNLVLGPKCLYAVPLILFFSISINAFGIIASMFTKNVTSSILLFIGFLLFFLILQLGTYLIVGEYISNFSNIVRYIFQWVSPLYYWSIGIRAIYSGIVGRYFGSLFLLLALTTILMTLGHFIIKVKGMV